MPSGEYVGTPTTETPLAIRMAASGAGVTSTDGAGEDPDGAADEDGSLGDGAGDEPDDPGVLDDTAVSDGAADDPCGVGEATGDGWMTEAVGEAVPVEEELGLAEAGVGVIGAGVLGLGVPARVGEARTALAVGALATGRDEPAEVGEAVADGCGVAVAFTGTM